MIIGYCYFDFVQWVIVNGNFGTQINNWLRYHPKYSKINAGELEHPKVVISLMRLTVTGVDNNTSCIVLLFVKATNKRKWVWKFSSLGVFVKQHANYVKFFRTSNLIIIIILGWQTEELPQLRSCFCIAVVDSLESHTPCLRSHSEAGFYGVSVPEYSHNTKSNFFVSDTI